MLKQSNGACGSSSVVECHLAKVDVASSNLVYRSISKTWNFRSSGFFIMLSIDKTTGCAGGFN